MPSLYDIIRKNHSQSPYCQMVWNVWKWKTPYEKILCRQPWSIAQALDVFRVYSPYERLVNEISDRLINKPLR